MVFNATFNNISVKSWRIVFLVEETGVHGENHRPVASHWQTLSHNVAWNTPHLGEIRTHNVSGHRHKIRIHFVLGNEDIEIIFTQIYHSCLLQITPPGATIKEFQFLLKMY